MASSYSGGRLFLLSFFWPGLLVQDEIATSLSVAFPFICVGNKQANGWEELLTSQI